VLCIFYRRRNSHRCQTVQVWWTPDKVRTHADERISAPSRNRTPLPRSTPYRSHYTIWEVPAQQYTMGRLSVLHSMKTEPSNFELTRANSMDKIRNCARHQLWTICVCKHPSIFVILVSFVCNWKSYPKFRPRFRMNLLPPRIYTLKKEATGSSETLPTTEWR
jgi:hypothetical protein